MVFAETAPSPWSFCWTQNDLSLSHKGRGWASSLFKTRCPLLPSWEKVPEGRMRGLLRRRALFDHRIRPARIAGAGFAIQIWKRHDAVVAEIEADDQQAAFFEIGEQAPGAAGGVSAVETGQGGVRGTGGGGDGGLGQHQEDALNVVGERFGKGKGLLPGGTGGGLAIEADAGDSELALECG